VQVESTFGSYGLPEQTYKTRDVWMRKELGEHTDVSAELPAHGSVLLELKP
jgi:Alpha galactosidase C-terminal beta sandwich domain